MRRLADAALILVFLLAIYAIDKYAELAGQTEVQPRSELRRSHP